MAKSEEGTPRILWIITGASGSGKTTLAHQLSSQVFEADHFFMTPGDVYNFNPALLAQAHENCQIRVQHWLLHGTTASAVVANTSVRREDARVYVDLVSMYNRNATNRAVQVRFIHLIDGGLTPEKLAERNVHNVPVESIRRQLRDWHDTWGQAAYSRLLLSEAE